MLDAVASPRDDEDVGADVVDVGLERQVGLLQPIAERLVVVEVEEVLVEEHLVRVVPAGAPAVESGSDDRDRVDPRLGGCGFEREESTTVRSERTDAGGVDPRDRAEGVDHGAGDRAVRAGHRQTRPGLAASGSVEGGRRDAAGVEFRDPGLALLLRALEAVEEKGDGRIRQRRLHEHGDRSCRRTARRAGSAAGGSAARRAGTIRPARRARARRRPRRARSTSRRTGTAARPVPRARRRWRCSRGPRDPARRRSGRRRPRTTRAPTRPRS